MLDITNEKANVLVKEQTSLIFVSSIEFLYGMALLSYIILIVWLLRRQRLTALFQTANFNDFCWTIGHHPLITQCGSLKCTIFLD